MNLLFPVTIFSIIHVFFNLKIPNVKLHKKNVPVKMTNPFLILKKGKKHFKKIDKSLCGAKKFVRLLHRKKGDISLTEAS